MHSQFLIVSRLLNGKPSQQVSECELLLHYSQSHSNADSRTGTESSVRDLRNLEVGIEPSEMCFNWNSCEDRNAPFRFEFIRIFAPYRFVYVKGEGVHFNPRILYCSHFLPSKVSALLPFQCQFRTLSCPSCKCASWN